MTSRRPGRTVAVLAVLLGSMLVAPAAARATEPGINTPLLPLSEAQYQAVAQLQSKSARMFVNWASMEPSPGGHQMLQYHDQAIARYNAMGIKVVLVITAAPGWASGSPDNTVPPRNPADYANFAAFVAKRWAGKVAVWEIWNEPDDTHFWKNAPEPARYTQLLQAAYPAIKQADPSAKVIVGPLVGGHYQFLEQIYAYGGKGYFDGVGVHTDYACNTRAPDDYYRELDGKIGRFTFTSYRELHATMLQNGDAKPIYMTELGWPTEPGTCRIGGNAGKKPAGVSEAQQAEFVTKAYHCLKPDTYVSMGMWFSLNDVTDGASNSQQFGLMRSDLSHKPSFDSYKSFFTAGDPLSGPCGGQLDTDVPRVTLHRPGTGDIYFKNLQISASANDIQGVRRITLFANGKVIRHYNEGKHYPKSKPAARLNWQGAKDLPFGEHTITVQARDEAMNTAEASMVVRRVNPKKLRPVRTFAEAKLLKRKSRSRKRTVKGKMIAPTLAALTMTGKARVEFQHYTTRRKKGSKKRIKVWKTNHKFHKNASRPFTVRAKMRKSGRWRVRVVYSKSHPFKASRSKYTYFRVK